MRAAIATRLAAGALAVCLLAGGAGPAAPQGASERGQAAEPRAGAPDADEGGSPAQARPDGEGEEGAPAEDAAPGGGQGCPDLGRKLELVV